MNKVKLVAISIGILSTAACAAPWYVGMRTERVMRADAETPADGKQSAFAVAFTRFDRGWLTSEAVTRITLKADPSIYLDVRHEISHTPDRSSWARVHSVPQWTGPVKATFDYYFGGQPALTVDTTIGYDGSHVSQFTSPAFTKPLHQQPEATVTWGGMHGTVSVDADKHLVASASVPNLLVEGGSYQATVKMLKLDATWDMHGSAIDWQGETKLGLAEFHMVTPLQQAAVKDIAGAVYQRSKGDSVLLGYALRVGFGSSAQAGAPGDSFSNAVLELELDKLNKAALSKYLADLGNADKLTMEADARTRLATQLTMNLAAELLRGSPQLHLKKLGIDTPSGSILAHASIGFDGNNMPDMPFSPDLLMRLKAKADVKVSGTLLRTQMQNQVRPKVEVALSQQGGTSSEENIRVLSEKMIEDQLKGFTDAGWLRASGTDFVVEAEFAAGQVSVNGQPANQLFGGMLASPLAPATPSERVPESEASVTAPSAALAERRLSPAPPPSTLR